jgi:DNA-binding winged helix-turn-helix (wHTH) protein/tetratricopeptide (TPR) repeat protein
VRALGVSGEEAARGAINLARIAPFRLGALDVRPATRQLARGPRSETLEPRVMQVLVALWQAQGAVLSLDDLIARCWDGRIVGDNAIQRTISRLRDIADGIGEGCFDLETINKVGYRLTALHSAAVASAEAPAKGVLPQLVRWEFWPLMLGAAGLALAGFIGLILATRSSAANAITIAISAQSGGAAELADGVAVDLARLANERSNAFAFSSGPENGRAEYQVKITRQNSRHAARADITLLKSGSPAALWSASFAARDSDALRPQMANAIFQAASCALQTNNNPSDADGDTLRLVFSACERLDPEGDGTAVELWRKINARDPGNARVLATLALQETEWADQAPTLVYMEKREHTSLSEAARTHLLRARAMEPSLGLTYAAEAWLMPHGRFAEVLATVERGLALDPDCAELHALKSQLFTEVGRVDDARDEAVAAAELEPSSGVRRAAKALALAYAGYAQTAAADLQTAERIWPNSEAVREARQNFDFRYGDAVPLLQAIEKGTLLRPYASTTAQNGWMRAYLQARVHSTPASIDNAVELLSSYNNPLGTLQSIVQLGRIDAAYGYVSQARNLPWFRDGGTYVLFRSFMRPFLFDRRFMAFADRVGLVQYWQSTNIWPDFCREKKLPYDCKAEARHLHPTKSA